MRRNDFQKMQKICTFWKKRTEKARSLSEELRGGSHCSPAFSAPAVPSSMELVASSMEPIICEAIQERNGR